MKMPNWIASVSVACAVLAWAGAASGTPSTTYWAPSTTYVQPFLVPHLTYDTYFWKTAAYPIDTGVTMGVLPFEPVQLEVGCDVLLPTANPLQFFLHAKLGTPEGTFFEGSPSLAVGVFGVGVQGKSDDNLGTSYDGLYVQIQENLPWGGYVSTGGYYGVGTEELWLSSDGSEHRAGFMGAVTSPDININLPGLKKLVVVADVQSGKNVFGAAGGGISFYFTDNIALLTGPVYFFEGGLQPGGESWMWTAQLDVDIPLLPAPAPAAPKAPAAPAEPATPAPTP